MKETVSSSCLLPLFLTALPSPLWGDQNPDSWMSIELTEKKEANHTSTLHYRQPFQRGRNNEILWNMRVQSNR